MHTNFYSLELSKILLLLFDLDGTLTIISKFYFDYMELEFEF
jgi:FMN phosphatase YigB (HAD superfamily)